jgi:hypothetical protein
LKILRADFARMKAELNACSERYRGNIDGGGQLALEANVILKNVRIESAGEHLCLTATHHGRPEGDGPLFRDFTRQTTMETTPAPWVFRRIGRRSNACACGAAHTTSP